MTPTDVLGNPIMKGDLVVITTESKEQFFGEVQEVNESGLINPHGGKDAMPIPGRVVVAIAPMILFFDPHAPMIKNILKPIRPPKKVVS